MEEKLYIPLNDILKQPERYYAHIKPDQEGPGDGLKRELLEQHTGLCQKYFRRLWEAKGMDGVLERFIAGWFKEFSKEARIFLIQMVFNIVTFHDTGKCNPTFQEIKMQTDQKIEAVSFGEYGSRHSLLSAVLYINYFKRRLKTKEVQERDDRISLRVFLLLHSYVIAKHHGSLDSFQEYINKYDADDMGVKGGGAKLIDRLVKEGGGLCSTPFEITSKEAWNMAKHVQEKIEKKEEKQWIQLFCYTRLLYSLLTAADYYATAEFMSGVEITEFGTIRDLDRLAGIYQESGLVKKIRAYEKEKFPHSLKELKRVTDINELRSELFLEVERELTRRAGKYLFYLEAPTGSGKSNTAMNISFRLLELNQELGKIYYVYPFNTLVEQNMKTIADVFGTDKQAMDYITVVNSISPIKAEENKRKREEENEDSEYYQKALLDRQFLNYPVVVTTHVSLFDTMFGNRKEAVFGFHQLINSVIVLDEIQSYRNTIWGEIITFFQTMAPLLNIRFVIMSATLPNLNLLTGGKEEAVMLLPCREKYFLHPGFQERVRISYELLKFSKADIWEALYRHVKEHYLAKGKEAKKLLVEFITKKSAYAFYKRLMEDKEITGVVEYMSGDDSQPERKRILERVSEGKEPALLIATQVMEAGVDIDMDVGYKDISRLDSEEQFMGRINRSCRRKGIVYFFDLDDAKSVYGEDVRIGKEFTLENERMRKILAEKDFGAYYQEILKVLHENYMSSSGREEIRAFFRDAVGELNFGLIKERMELIREDSWSMSVFLNRRLIFEGEELDGGGIWEEYKKLLENNTMGYAEKRVRLSRLTSRVNMFLYQIKKNSDLIYNDRIGDIFYIEDGEKYFTNGKLDRDKFEGEVGGFVDFI